MWTCPQCGRIFKKANQPHSCRKVPLEEHFKNKQAARMLFDFLVERINSRIRGMPDHFPALLHPSVRQV